MTRKTDYALVALTDLAAQMPAKVSARELATKLKLPVPALMNVLNQLMHAGLVTSSRGPNGGYGLARAPGAITLAEMIEAVEGPVKLALCCSKALDHDDRRCNLEPECVVKEPMRRVHESLHNFLSRVTLEHIASNDVPVNLCISAGGGASYAPATGAIV